MQPRLNLAVAFALGILSWGNAIASLQPRVGNVTLGDSRKSVTKTLGTPEKVIATGDSLDPRLEYHGITIWLGEGGDVEQIQSTSSKYCTASGVCPGMPFAKAAAILGKPMGESPVSDGKSSYVVDATACWLEVTVKAWSVSMLELKCQP